MFCHYCGCNHTDEALFCSKCGAKFYNETPKFHPVAEISTEENAVLHYFEAGFVYSSIVMLLSKYHGIQMSVRTLKRRLRGYGVDRSRNANDNVVRNIISKEVKGPSSLLGYRSMWNLLKQSYKINVPRDSVMNLLKDIDPEGTERRKSRRLQRRTYYSHGKFCLRFFFYAPWSLQSAVHIL